MFLYNTVLKCYIFFSVANQISKLIEGNRAKYLPIEKEQTHVLLLEGNTYGLTHLSSADICQKKSTLESHLWESQLWMRVDHCVNFSTF